MPTPLLPRGIGGVYPLLIVECFLFSDLEALEDLEEHMVDAFRSVLMLFPSEPTNPRYDEFLDQSRDYSYKPPFNAPKPPYPELKLQVQALTDLRDEVNACNKMKKGFNGRPWAETQPLYFASFKSNA